MRIRAVGDETRAGGVGRDVVILRVGEGLNLVGPGLDGRFFQIDPRFCRVCFDQPDMIEQELVAARSPELPLFEEHADFRCGAVVVVGHGLHDDRHLVRGIALESHVLERGLVTARACALGDGPFDDVLGYTFLACLFQRRSEPRIRRRIRPAMTRRDGDFADKLARRLRFPERGNFTLGQQPLTSHRRRILSESLSPLKAACHPSAASLHCAA